MINVNAIGARKVPSNRNNISSEYLCHYQKHSSKPPTLSRKEVIEYTQQVQQMMKLLHLKQELGQELQQSPTIKHWANRAKLSERAIKTCLQQGDRARRKMIEANLGFVVKTAQVYQKQGIDLMDLIQEGTIGLTRAMEKFDPAKGESFSTYAYHWIRREIGRAVARTEKAELIPTELEELTESPSPEETVAQLQQAEVVSDLVSQLPPRQQQVISLLFGLEDGKLRSLNQVAQELGLSREQVRWARKEALKSLKNQCPQALFLIR